MGHIEFEGKFENFKIQCLDTPGILDRPMSKRNRIELQAILALRFISDLIVFVFDPTPASGYDIKSQIDLFNEVKQNFSKEGEIEIIIIFNKMDLAKDAEISFLKDHLKLEDGDFYITNALKGENLDIFIDSLQERYAN
jgi:nucleolar GTP-binding protein